MCRTASFLLAKGGTTRMRCDAAEDPVVASCCLSHIWHRDFVLMLRAPHAEHDQGERFDILTSSYRCPCRDQLCQYQSLSQCQQSCSSCRLPGGCVTVRGSSAGGADTDVQSEVVHELCSWKDSPSKYSHRLDVETIGTEFGSLPVCESSKPAPPDHVHESNFKPTNHGPFVPSPSCRHRPITLTRLHRDH